MRIIESIKSRIRLSHAKNFENTKYGKRLAKFKDSHKGEKCFVIGNGPSLKVEDLEELRKRNIPTFSTNRIFKLFDKTEWRPTYYVSEDILLMRDAQKIIKDMPVKGRFIPINLNWFENVDISNADYFYMEYQENFPESFNLSLDVAKRIRCRGTVTISCIQLAIYMGFSEIYLIGVDHNFAKMFDKNGNVVVDNTIKNHFADDYDKGIIDQGFHVDEATEAYMDAEKLSRKLKTFRIYNATRGGKLEVYERVDLDTLFETL
jgi:hypothetical protein